jgi:SARP family transcriptional regulator, regulator of embCAB operon
MIDILLFGQARLFDGYDQVMPDFHGIKPRHVLMLLAIHFGHSLSKERLADALWQGNPPASWVSTLEGYVSLLRRALARLHPGEPSVVLTRGRGYQLDTARVRVDLHDFDAALTEAEAARGALSLPALARALDIASGDVLAGERPLGWVLEARDRYAHRVCQAAVKAGRLALQSGEIETAARYGQLARDLDPLAEDGWRLIIETEWLDSRRSDALRSFNTVRSLLDRELGIAPCRELQDLFVRMLHDQPLAMSA